MPAPADKGKQLSTDATDVVCQFEFQLTSVGSHLEPFLMGNLGNHMKFREVNFAIPNFDRTDNKI